MTSPAETCRGRDVNKMQNTSLSKFHKLKEGAESARGGADSRERPRDRKYVHFEKDFAFRGETSWSEDNLSGTSLSDFPSNKRI